MIDKQSPDNPFSPRVWGWSGDHHESAQDAYVFPTGVGMVLQKVDLTLNSTRFPHGCGDGPAAGVLT